MEDAYFKYKFNVYIHLTIWECAFWIVSGKFNLKDKDKLTL